MKNLIAFGLCLAAFNAYSNDTENAQTEQVTTITTETTREFNPETEAMTLEQAIEDTVTAPEHNLVHITTIVEPQIITLTQAEELFNSAEGIEFFAMRGLTPSEAFDVVINLLHDIANKIFTVDGNEVEVEGVSITMNDKNYFIKAYEELTDTNTESNDESVLNS